MTTAENTGRANAHVETGTLNEVEAAVRAAVSDRWPHDKDTGRRYVAIVTRTSGGLVLRVFPEWRRAKPAQGE